MKTRGVAQAGLAEVAHRCSMQTNTGWIWLASMMLLACNNSAPLADLAEPASAWTSSEHPRACEVAERSSVMIPEQTRDLYAAVAATADSGSDLLSAYAGGCSERLSGSYALAVELDVFMQDDPVATEHDPGRGRAKLLLRLDLADPKDALQLRLCDLTLPERYVYATSGVTQLRVSDEAWDQPNMPVWKSAIHFASDAELQLAAFPALLGIALAEPGARWPTYEETPALDCGEGHNGSACFPDHDADGEPGFSLHVQASGEVSDAPYAACEAWHYAAPSTQPEAWSSGIGAEPSRLFVGLRTALQLFLRFDQTCTRATGRVQAADIVTRVLDCELAGGERCSAPQATVLDARAPTFHVLAEGEVPPQSFRDSRAYVDEALDRSPSAGGKLVLQRLPDDAASTCTPVRAAFAR